MWAALVAGAGCGLWGFAAWRFASFASSLHPYPCPSTLSSQICALLVSPMQFVIKFRTAQLEHEFGCPFQLGHHEHANAPDDADLATFPVAKGDVVVMGR